MNAHLLAIETKEEIEYLEQVHSCYNVQYWTAGIMDDCIWKWDYGNTGALIKMHSWFVTINTLRIYIILILIIISNLI